MTPRSRAALCLLAGATLCAALALWLRSPSEPRPLGRTGSGTGAESAPPATEPTPGAETAHAARSTAASEPATTAPPAGETPPASRDLHGTLRYFDPLGAHRPVVHGTFRLHSDSEDEPRTIPVEDGLWQVDVPEDAFEVSVFVADGAPAFLHASNYGFYAFPADGTLELLVRRDHGCRLVVVDAASGRELRDVEVVQDRGRGQWGKQSPANSPDEVRIAEHAPSPIELDLEDGTAQYFVRSPGYAWRFAIVQRSACGDYLVALLPGGDLTVTLAGAPVPEGAELRLRRVRQTDDPYAAGFVDHRRALTLLDRRIDFEGIEAGEYEASVEVGVDSWRPARVAAAKCVVERGKRSELELVLPTPELANLVAIAGTIRTNGWPSVNRLSFHSRFSPRVGGRYQYVATLDASLEGEVASEIPWSLPQIEPGSYSGFLGGPSFYFDLEIEPAAKRDYVIELPRVADVRLKVLDARTGEIARVKGVGWLGYAGEWRPDGMINDAEFDAELGAWRFLAPATTVSLWVNDDAYEFRNTPQALAPGINELTLKLPRACGVIATFVHAGEPIARAASWEIDLADLSGKRVGFANPIDDAETELILKAPAPGPYRISARGVDGYRIVSPLEVTVPVDDFARVVIELDRVR